VGGKEEIKNSQNVNFFLKKMRTGRKTGPVWGVGTSGRGEDIRVWEGEYGRNTMYTYM
jgi:hypothetical protein